jgi:hypothetical protein
MQAIGGYGKTALGAGALHGWHVRHLNPVERVMRIARLPYLAKRCTHMLYPNYPGRSPSNRHYCYKRGVGWVSDIVTLSRPSTKYDVINGVLTTIPAGELSANGRVEPATVSRITNSNDKANWILAGIATAVDITDGPGGYGAIRTTGVGTSGADYIYIATGGYAADAQLRESLYIRKISGGSGNLTVAHQSLGPGGGVLTVPVAGLPTGVWVRLDRASSYVSSSAQWIATAAGISGPWLYGGGGMSFDIAFCNETESQTYTTSPILAAGGVTARAADAWSISDAGLADVKSMASIIRCAGGTYHYCLCNTPITKVMALDSTGPVQWDATAGTMQMANRTSGAFDAMTANFYTVINGYMNGTKYTSVVAPENHRLFTKFDVGYNGNIGGDEHALHLLFDRELTDAEAAALTSTAFKNAIAAGL